jgi:calcineurin-like phosphoesterase family protein
MSNIFETSQTKCNTYRRCKYAYWLRYIEKLRKKVKGRPLQFGSIVHEMLEAHANADDPMEKLTALVEGAGSMFSSQRDDFEDMIQDIEDIMTSYFEMDWGDDELMFLPRKGRFAEHEFRVEIAKGIVLTGKMDAMAKTKDKRRWLVENKTFTNMPNADHRWRNLQSNTYVRVNEMLGLPEIDGLCWNYICSRSPGVPKILKDGTVSKKRLNTTPARLARFFRENKLKAKDYPTLVRSTEANLKHYFARIFSAAKKATVDLVFKDLIETSLEMANNHGRLKAKTIDRHCEWCDYEPICRAELQKADVEFIKKKEYYVSGKEESSKGVTRDRARRRG